MPRFVSYAVALIALVALVSSGAFVLARWSEEDTVALVSMYTLKYSLYALAFCAANKQGRAIEMDRLIWDKGFNARQFDMLDVPMGGPQPAEKPAPGQAQPQGMVKCWDHPDGRKNVYGWASELGLNMDKFKSDMKGECNALVEADRKHLNQFQVASGMNR